MKPDTLIDTPLTTPEEFWGLNAPLRLPTDKIGWETYDPHALMTELELNVHSNDYATTVGIPSKKQTLRKVALLIEAFPADFTAVAERISPEGWRLLYYSGTYVLECLSSFRFHADQELRHICEFREFTDGLPAAWIGTTVDPRTIADEVSGILATFHSGEAKAAYCVLAAAQRISLLNAEVLCCRWWDPVWIHNLAGRLNADL